MSFTEPETQALGAIADGLAGSDPRLAWPARYITHVESYRAGEERW